MAAHVNIDAFKRVPFLDSIDFIGPDWAAADFALQIRNSNGDTGTALVSLTKQTAGTQGISCTYNASYVWVDQSGVSHTSAASIVLINISEATVEGLSLNNPVSEPLTLKYDLHVTPSGGTKFVAAYGDFTVYPGSTI